MLQPLSDSQAQWVDSTLASMTLEQCAGQLLCGFGRQVTPEEWPRLAEQVGLGSLGVMGMPGAELRHMIRQIQDNMPVPLLMAGDLEHGAKVISDEATIFPRMMAAGAANDPALMTMMGRATAAEGRGSGMSWTFSPVIDLNYNFNNPITNIRALSDDPERVIRLAVPLVQALQENGLLAATAKHFPGDGVDDRDQHLVTTINTLPFDQWQATYGQVWRAIIDAGVMSVMIGHISLPDFQGHQDNPVEALPATLSSPLLNDLLRDELGFDGLIVTDASPMQGLTSWVPAEERVVRCIEAGCDVYLFADPVEDSRRLVEAVRSGRLTEERVQQAARRVLEMKARLNLHQDPFATAPSPQDRASFEQAAQDMAAGSIASLRNDDSLPLALKPGDRVLTVTVGQINDFRQESDLDDIDNELRQRGFQVDHLLNPDDPTLMATIDEYAAVFINLLATPYAIMGAIRNQAGHIRSSGWRSLFVERPGVVYTAFGNPYVLYEMPRIPNLVAAFGHDPISQQAAVKVWLGEIQPQGDCPVQMPTIRIRPLEVE